MNDFKQIKSIKVKADNSELDSIRKFILQISQENKLDENTSFKILLAVEEAFVNLVKHTYNNDPSKEILIEVQIEGKKLQITLEDNGISFDPRTVLPIELEQIRKKIKKGGLGILLISNLMDEINYIPKSEKISTNKLILTKILE